MQLQRASMKSVAEYEQKHDRLRSNCPVKASIDVIRGRWKPSILFELKGGTKRFSQIQAALLGITAQALTLQLRQLEADDVVSREIFADVPPRVEYTLTKRGAALSTVMDQLEAWGADYLKRKAPVPKSR